MSDFARYVESVRAHVSVEDVLTQRYGIEVADHQALCPFHADNDPSLSTTDELYHCFACQAGGDVFRLVQRLDNVSFTAAVDALATHAGLPPRRDSARDRAAVEAERITSDLTEWSVDHYSLRRTPEVDDYLASRGLPPWLIAQAKLGWADGTLCEAVAAAGGQPQALVGAGLAASSSQGPGAVADWLQDRVTFPALRQGRGIFLSGRTMVPDTMPKYLHQRGRAAPLYNEDAINGEFVLLVEGQVDALSLMAWRYPVVGLLGTPHAAHVAQLRRPKMVYLGLDADAAGRRAMVKLSVELADRGKFRTRIIQFPDGLDPNDYVRQHTREQFEALAENALDPVLAMLQWLPSPPESTAELDPLFGLLAAAGPLEQLGYLRGSIAEWAAKDKGLIKAIERAWREYQKQQSVQSDYTKR